MANQDSGTIDLGSKPSEDKMAMPSKDSAYYPSLHINNVDGLDNLPDGEFTFTGKGKLISYTESMRNGKNTCSCEIEVHSIKPLDEGSKKSKDGGDRLDESLDEIANHKMNDAEDYADESDE